MLGRRRASAEPRTGTPVDFLVVGLGNPGIDFAGTRHNMGADVAAALADRYQGRLKSEKGLRSSAGEIRIGGRRVLVAVPQTFMNESGQAVAPLVRRAGDGSTLIVVHDELDLPSGRVKVKSGGGNAGNNGLKSVESHLHTNQYVRVRVGIGKPPGRQAGADYVLRRPGAAERAILAEAVENAADAVELIVTEGVEAAMNRVNTAV